MLYRIQWLLTIVVMWLCVEIVAFSLNLIQPDMVFHISLSQQNGIIEIPDRL